MSFVDPFALSLTGGQRRSPLSLVMAGGLHVAAIWLLIQAAPVVLTLVKPVVYLEPITRIKEKLQVQPIKEPTPRQFKLLAPATPSPTPVITPSADPKPEIRPKLAWHLANLLSLRPR